MDKKQIVQVLQEILEGKITPLEQKQDLQIFLKTLELEIVKEEYTQLQQSYDKLEKDYAEASVEAIKLCEEISNLEKIQAEVFPFIDFMSNLVIETRFGESTVKEAAKILWKGQELGPQPSDDKEESIPSDGCCGGSCGCH